MANKKTLGSKIFELREANNLSQKKLGEIVGVSDVYVSYIERDLRTPSLTVIKRLAQLFKVSIDELIY